MTVEVAGVSHAFGDLKALDEVSFKIAAGEVLGYLGPNGAGKSTTVRIMLGLLKPDRGSIHVAGVDVATDPIEVRRRVGYLPEVSALYDGLSPREHARFVGRLRGLDDATIERRFAAILAAFDLADRQDEPVRGFSKGMRQKTSIALAIFHDPKVLLLDEPLSGLDAQATQLLKELIRGFASRGAAVFYSSHVLDVVERVCDRAVILDRGRVVTEGTIDDLRSRARETTLEAVFRSVVDPTGDPAAQARAVLAEIAR